MAESADEKRARERQELRQALQARILNSGPEFDDVTADDVWRGIKAALVTAYNDDLLATPPEKIHEHVPKPVIDRNFVEIRGGLVDGKKPFSRTPDQARINRSDKAWLHFTLTLECGTKGTEKGKVVALHAYDFELVLPEGHTPPFVRFDLNEPDHPNELREIRSHMHAGNDDLLLPAPVMTPLELIDVLVRGFRNRRGDEKSRA